MWLVLNTIFQSKKLLFMITGTIGNNPKQFQSQYSVGYQVGIGLF